MIIQESLKVKVILGLCLIIGGACLGVSMYEGYGTLVRRAFFWIGFGLAFIGFFALFLMV